ncbi:ARID DNA-binding domain-containing protein [Tanacetum coccineum]
MVNTNTFLEAKWLDQTRHKGHKQQWYQSEIHGRPPRKMSQTEFFQRQIKREKENRIGRYVRQITRDCKKMLQRNIEEFEAFNSSLPGNKYMNYNCFYCNQNGHIMKTCPTKIKNDAAHTQNISGGIMEGNKINPTQSEFTSDKSKILCFKCRQYGHFANKCPPEKQDHPKVSLKYPEFIHFQTKGIIKGTDKDSWDNFWYVSITSDKHLTSDIKSFSNFKEEFLVEKLEGQGNFLFTYGMGEVLIKDGSNGYLIPGVHFAPKITINILSINLLKQQARAPEHPIKGGEDSSLEEHQWNIGEKGAQIAVEKGKEKLEHFGIKLEEEDSKQQQTAYYGNSQITCYKCQDFGHYAFECPTKNKGKDQIKNSSYKEPSTSRPIENPTDAVNYTGAVLDDLMLICVTEQSCLCAVFNNFMGKFECSSSSHAPDKMAKQKEKSSFDAATVSYKEAAAYCAGMVLSTSCAIPIAAFVVHFLDSPNFFESSSWFCQDALDDDEKEEYDEKLIEIAIVY